MNFNTIPANILTPGNFFEFDSSRAFSGLLPVKHKVLLIGQRLATGTVAALVPTRITSKADGEAFFGRGSQLSDMVNTFKNNNDYTELWACALDDLGAGVKATGALQVTGPATGAGTLTVYIGGQKVQVAVAAADTASAIAANLVTAVNAQTDLPVTALIDGVDNTKVNLTARHKGETYNFVDLRANYNLGDAFPKGVGINVTAMATGTGNPDITTVLAAIGAEQYHTMVEPYIDATNLTALETELENRWGGMTQNDAFAYTSVGGSHASISTLGSGRNGSHLAIVGAQKSPTLPWKIATAFAARDAFEADPARPRQTLPLTDVLPPKESDRYTRSERNIHLAAGVATFVVDAGGVCRIDRIVTTYKTNAAGVADPAYRDVETLRTLSFLRFDVRSLIALRFPRHKLAGDGSKFGAGQPIATPKTIRGELIARAGQWVEAGLVEDVTQFTTDLVVEINGTDPNVVDVVLPPNLVNQLRVMRGSFAFRL